MACGAREVVVAAWLEKRSFFGDGGEKSSGLAKAVGGVEGAGWVSWPVRAVAFAAGAVAVRAPGCPVWLPWG